MKNQIIKALERASGKAGSHLEFSSRSEFGDYTSNIAMGSKNPREAAEKIVEKLNKDKDLKNIVEKIEVAGPARLPARQGFINFHLSTKALTTNLSQIIEEKENYGKSDGLKAKKLMFEFAHPNTHKAFHIGHLRNITTGESLARLNSFIGADVVRVNYQGDVGLHIAKALWGIMKLGFDDPKDIQKRAEFLGKAYSTGSTAYEESEDVKKEVNDLNKKVYSKEDEKVNKLYMETRQWSLDYFDSIYKRVYTKFDRLYFESECYESGKEIALKALKDGVLEKSEGAIIFPGSKYGLHDRVFISGKGVPTYEAKDFGLAKLEFGEFEPEKILHVVGPEQSSYFQVVFKAIEMVMPETKGREIHIPYGWVKLKTGKMSSRTGNVVLGEWLLDEAKNKIISKYKTKEDIAEQIAVAAVKYSFLKTGLNQEIAFDINESISFEGNSGPYLQYTYARTQSVLQKSNIKNYDFKESYSMLPISSNNFILTKKSFNLEERLVLRELIKFPEIISLAALTYSPNILCEYLFNLAQKYNGFYNKHKIIDGDNVEFRLALTFATGQVLKNGLTLLGIASPEKM